MKVQLLVIAFMLSAARLNAQAPVLQDTIPANYTLLSQHGPVRVLRFAGVPGAKTEMHAHPPHFAYVLRGGVVRFTYPDGQIRDAVLQTGQTFEIPTPLSHAIEVLGGDTVAVLVVEYRLPGATPDSTPRRRRE